MKPHKIFCMITALLFGSASLYMGFYIFGFVAAAPPIEGIFALFIWSLSCFTTGCLLAEGMHR